MNQITIGGHQLIVVAAHKLPPGEVSIGSLRHIHREEEAQRIRVIALKIIGEPNRPVATGGKRPALKGQELIGGDIVGEVEPTIAHKHRRPDYGVERDIVLAYEVIGLGISLPKITPPLLIATGTRPLLARREIADYRLKPHIDSLILKAGHGYRDAPLYIPGNGPVLQPFGEKVDSEVEYVGLPVRLTFHPIEKLLVKSAEAEKKMLRFPDLREGGAYSAIGVDKLHGIEGLAAIIALISPCPFEAAIRACALHIAIGQESVATGAVKKRHGVLIDMALILQSEE